MEILQFTAAAISYQPVLWKQRTKIRIWNTKIEPSQWDDIQNPMVDVCRLQTNFVIYYFASKIPNCDSIDYV